jgi:hypothetical protein
MPRQNAVAGTKAVAPMDFTAPGVPDAAARDADGRESGADSVASLVVAAATLRDAVRELRFCWIMHGTAIATT